MSQIISASELVSKAKLEVFALRMMIPHFKDSQSGQIDGVGVLALRNFIVNYFFTGIWPYGSTNDSINLLYKACIQIAIVCQFFSSIISLGIRSQWKQINLQA